YQYTDEPNSCVYFASESVFLKDAFPQASIEKIIQIKPGTFLMLKDGKSGLHHFSMESENIAPHPIASASTFTINDLSPPENKSSAIHHYSFVNDLNKIRLHDFNYKKIYAIRRCAKCILPATTPFITFDTNGVCNFCNEHEKISHKEYDSLEAIVSKFRKGTGEPDCMAAFSGGRDSSYGLHFLKKELGLQPLAYTYDWGMVTDIARKNQARILGKMGIEHIVVSADITTKRKHISDNILAWMKRPDLGMVPLFMEGDKQCEYYADKLMRKYNLKLMFFFRGNELEKEEFKNG